MKPNAVRDILIRGVLAGETPVDVLLDWCEEADCRPWPIEEPPPTSWHEDSPGGQRLRVFAHDEFSAFAALRGWHRRQGWERTEFYGAMMDGPDGPYTLIHTPHIDAVRGLIDRTKGTVECPSCRGYGDDSWGDFSYPAPGEMCHDCNGAGRFENPDCPRILELYALMLRDAGGHREEYVHIHEPMGDMVGRADIVPGMLHVAAKGLWPTQDVDGGSVRWHSDLAYSKGPPWVVPEVLLAAMPEFNAASGSEAYWDTRTEALHALARAIVTATVECECVRVPRPRGGAVVHCSRCHNGRVPYLEASE